MSALVVRVSKSISSNEKDSLGCLFFVERKENDNKQANE